MVRILILLLTVMALGGCTGKDLGVFENMREDQVVEDTVILHAVNTLDAELGSDHGTVSLSWLAPGGDAIAYDIRYSTEAITAANFTSAEEIIGEPAPLASQTEQSLNVTGLMSNKTYYFAMKVIGPENRNSGLSNVVFSQSAQTAAKGSSTFLISGKVYDKSGVPVSDGYVVTVVNERSNASNSSSGTVSGVYSISIVDLSNAPVVYEFDKLTFGLRDSSNNSVNFDVHKVGDISIESGSPVVTVSGELISTPTLTRDLWLTE